MQDVLRRSGRFDLDEDVSCMRWSEVDKSNRHAGERALQSTIPGVSARFVTAPRVGRDLVRVPADLREVSTSRRARASRADAQPAGERARSSTRRRYSENSVHERANWRPMAIFPHERTPPTGGPATQPAGERAPSLRLRRRRVAQSSGGVVGSCTCGRGRRPKEQPWAQFSQHFYFREVLKCNM